ncbi:fanconi anemia group M protein [Ceratobasidium sp. AG-Ba]|nr:fanconi anemia group M protein [Ceratobasidium sp. AG-Ba]
MFDVFWGAPALVHNLTSIKLLPDSTFTEGQAFTTVLGRMLKKIGNRCPKLERFWLRAVGMDSMYGEHPILTTALDGLSRLPIQSLWLEGVEALANKKKTKGASAREQLTTMTQEMKAMFPNLKVLGFPNTISSFADLPGLITALPKLEAICFDFLASVHAGFTKVDLEQVARYRTSPLHTVEIRLYGKQILGEEVGMESLMYEQAIWLAE